MVGPSGLEPPTSCLSGTRSNLLSYDPMWLFALGAKVENCKLQIASYFHLPFAISNFPLRSFASPMVEMMVIREKSASRLSRQICLRKFAPVGSKVASSLLWDKRPTSPGPSSHGGDDGIRTHDPLLAGQVLSQLSYTPKI